MTKSESIFDTDDLNADKPAALKELILDMMLSWPKLEQGITIWIAFAQGVSISIAAANLGPMSNKNKLKRLAELYASNGDHEAIDLLRNITKEHETFSEVRNNVAHAMLIGTSKSNPNEAVFLTSRAMPGQHGFMEARRLAFSNFKEARDFAIERAADILRLLKARGVDVG